MSCSMMTSTMRMRRTRIDTEGTAKAVPFLLQMLLLLEYGGCPGWSAGSVTPPYKLKFEFMFENNGCLVYRIMV